MREVKKSTAANVMVFMVDSTDSKTGKTGLTLTITASKNGAAFASISPTVTERGNGWYNLALTAAHLDTLGEFAVHITGSGADPSDFKLLVIAIDKADGRRAGLTALPDAEADAAGGLPISDAGGLFSGITSLAQWLGLLAGKQTGDTTARTEMNATGAGSGTFNETTDSLQAVRERGDAAWTTGDSGGEPGGVSVTIPITDQDSNPIADARVWITSDADGDTIVDGAYRTDSSGEVTFTLIAGNTYYAWATKDGQQALSGTPFTAVAD